ncbi:ParA family protein [Curtobacterium sp. VKM Ac-2887]|uniref:ParA family protein n=1 Tax=Curtobacterium sp. VKM Ac-2887 TaxID=2783819 RepID=UPI00188A76D1|nr:ParA family protein [Curtobacterium sp. VKM Ac-2887]MBF4588024.1 ParA family protein [Curtobacterium sp. VKM Ac-2887]
MASSIDRTNLQRVVAVINNKGGVGKTTLCANVAGIMGEGNWRVLVVDLDPQGNLGLDFGYHGTDRDDDGAGLSKALLYGDLLQPIEVRPNVEVVPGGRLVEYINTSLAQQFGQSGEAATRARLSLASALAKIGDQYDLILLDCPPNTDIIQSIAVAAARYILIPAKADEASYQGLTLTAERLDKVIDINPEVDLLGVVNFDSSASETVVRRDFAESVVQALGGEEARASVFETYVRHSGSTAKATREKRLLVHELDKKVKTGEKWYESIKRGVKHVAPGPQSAGSVADSLYAVTQELIVRLTEKEEEAARAAEVSANV